MGIPEAMWEQMRKKEHLSVFPENWQPVQLFVDLQTQWRSGMGGREGLIYSEVFRLMDEVGLRGKRKRMDVFRALQVMEGEALSIWAEKRKAAHRQ